ncbi:aspartate:proton symporter [Desulfotomaculum copahuensis]|uniref:Aspartate:proton symporter n=2 Tax=Desulfotomaculum copahuensis TaxID=1838280 RepID=A0A1B7LB65_9FIRM|nr:aspartate:proton symporter [Desulfotomaculum copahuensis]
MASLGGIIGSGWLFGSLFAANDAGPAAVFSWLIGGFAVLLIGLVYAELSSMIPESGGIVRFPQYSHGSLVSFIMGWAAWIGYCTVTSIEAEAVTQYANYYIPGLYVGKTLTPLGILVSAVLVIAFFLINWYGVRAFAAVNTRLTMFKFVMPVLTLFAFLLFGFHTRNFEHFGGFMPMGSAGVLKAIATAGVIFAFLGFRQSVDLAGEARNPQRDVPRAIVVSILIGVVLYALLQIVFVGALTPADLKAGWANMSMSSPFADVAMTLGLGWLAFLLFFDAVISPAGTGIVYTASTCRIGYALAQNGSWPRVFSLLHPKRGVPYMGMIINLIINLILLAPFPGWNKLVGVVSSAIVFTYVAGPVAALSLRRTGREMNRPLTVKGMGLIAPVAFIIASLIIYWSGWPTTGEVLITMLIGLPFYIYFYRRDKLPAEHVKAGIWLVIYLIFMIIMSYIGTFGKGELKLIPYPLDMLVVAAGSLVAFYWGVNSGIVTAEVNTAVRTQNGDAGMSGKTAHARA